MSYRRDFHRTMTEKPQDHDVPMDFEVKPGPKRKRLHNQAQSHNNKKVTQTQVDSWTLEQQSPPKIWIIGASQIRRAEPVARQKYGDNFGLDAQVSWFGKGGMGWAGVLPRFYQELSSQSRPDVLVLHAGGNDLGLIDPTELVSQMDKDLRRLQREFPQMKMIFSSLHERQNWRYGTAPSINEDRKKVNRGMRKVVQGVHGDIVEHHNIRFFNRRVFVPDGVHFTRYGNEIFLNNIQQVVKKVLRDISRPQQIQNQLHTSKGQTSHIQPYQRNDKPRHSQHHEQQQLNQTREQRGYIQPKCLYDQIQGNQAQQRQANLSRRHFPNRNQQQRSQAEDKTNYVQRQTSYNQPKRRFEQENYNQTQQPLVKRPHHHNLSNVTDLRMLLSR